MKKIVSICLVLAMLFTLLPFTVVSADDNDFEISGNKLVRYTGTSSSVTVPAEVEVIGSGAFMNNRTITSVRFAGKVTAIQSNAFAGCSKLARVSFADKEALESIGSYAFAGCLPMNPSWADGVKSVAGNAFDGCNIAAATAQPTNTPPVVQVVPTATPAPTVEPTIEPTVEPTAEPTVEPTVESTAEPTVAPTAEPTIEPTAEPTVEPTVEPTTEPAVEPTVEPTTEPTVAPTVEPTAEPTVEPTVDPTTEPTVEPTAVPTVTPTEAPAATEAPEQPEADVEDAVPPTLVNGDRTAPIVIVQQPENVQNIVGATAIFHVEAEGEGLTYQWYYMYGGASKFSVASYPGNNTDTMEVEIIRTRSGHQYYCLITDANGNTLQTETVKLTVGAPIVETPTIIITKQPEDVQNIVGKTATFHVEAEGEGLTYQWYYMYGGGSSFSVASYPGNNTDTMEVEIIRTRSGHQYYCLITDVNGYTVQSNTVKLTVGAPIVETPPIVITQQPEDVQNIVGETATFHVEAEGDGLTYQWYYMYGGASGFSVASYPGSTTDTMEVEIIRTRSGHQYYCLITDANGYTLQSDTVKLTVGAPIVETPPIVITQQPKDVQNLVGETATFHVEAEGEGLTYQWYYMYGGASKFSVASYPGNNTDTMEVEIIRTRSGHQYYCLITDANGYTLQSDTVKLTVGAPIAETPTIVITQQPKDVQNLVGETATFHVEAEGEGLTYQWYYMYGGASSFSVASYPGNNTDTMEVEIIRTRNGHQYYCLITDANGYTMQSETVKLTVGAPIAETPTIVITQQPENVQNLVGATATFHVEAEGEGLTYQWYYMYGGASSFSVASYPGNNTNTMEVEIIRTRNGHQYYCLITDADGYTLQSDIVKLTVLADTFVVDKVSYHLLDANNVEVQSYSGNAASLTIPATVNGYNVVRVGDAAFEGNATLASIDLPDSIQSIGSRAFANCSSLGEVK